MNVKWMRDQSWWLRMVSGISSPRSITVLGLYRQQAREHSTETLHLHKLSQAWASLDCSGNIVLTAECQSHLPASSEAFLYGLLRWVHWKQRRRKATSGTREHCHMWWQQTQEHVCECCLSCRTRVNTVCCSVSSKNKGGDWVGRTRFCKFMDSDTTAALSDLIFLSSYSMRKETIRPPNVGVELTAKGCQCIGNWIPVSFMRCKHSVSNPRMAKCHFFFFPRVIRRWKISANQILPIVSYICGFPIFKN